MKVKDIYDTLSDKIKKNIRDDFKDGFIKRISYGQLQNNNLPHYTTSNDDITTITMEKSAEKYMDLGVCQEYAQLVLYVMRGCKKEEKRTPQAIFHELNVLNTRRSDRSSNKIHIECHNGMILGKVVYRLDMSIPIRINDEWRKIIKIDDVEINNQTKKTIKEYIKKKGGDIYVTHEWINQDIFKDILANNSPTKKRKIVSPDPSSPVSPVSVMETNELTTGTYFIGDHKISIEVPKTNTFIIYAYRIKTECMGIEEYKYLYVGQTEQSLSDRDKQHRAQNQTDFDISLSSQFKDAECVQLDINKKAIKEDARCSWADEREWYYTCKYHTLKCDPINPYGMNSVRAPRHKQTEGKWKNEIASLIELQEVYNTAVELK